jgi:hypothetical protein
MKLTKNQLKQLIKEELKTVLQEGRKNKDSAIALLPQISAELRKLPRYCEGWNNAYVLAQQLLVHLEPDAYDNGQKDKPMWDCEQGVAE